MPLFHIHALMIIVSSIAAGGSIIVPSRKDLSDFLVLLQQFRPSWYSASPAIHRAILAQVKLNRHALKESPFRFIRSSSSPLPAELMAELEDVFKAPVIESYAMTEAAYQITSNPLPPRTRNIGSVGVVAGPEVRVMAESGEFMPPFHSGEIVIRGENVTARYDNNPVANPASFTKTYVQDRRCRLLRRGWVSFS
jgi:acyl-CoA synthetase (AMP-forming)/AMP-acid ligase II